ncbi:MAG: hypothetical protein ACFFAH_01900 [Promethearchaeota archaeon]
MKFNITSETSDIVPTTGFEKILNFFNKQLNINKPVGIQEIVDETGLSWSYIKKVLKKLLKEEYCGFHFEKVGNSWVTWKDREHIIKKMDNTCGRFLE